MIEAEARQRIAAILIEMDECERDRNGFSWQLLKEELAGLCRLLPAADVTILEREDRERRDLRAYLDSLKGE